MQKVSDLSPLLGIPLKVLKLAGTDVTDISVLERMPLEHLVANCEGLDRDDLEVIKALQSLEWLTIPQHRWKARISARPTQAAIPQL